MVVYADQITGRVMCPLCDGYITHMNRGGSAEVICPECGEEFTAEFIPVDEGVQKAHALVSKMAGRRLKLLGWAGDLFEFRQWRKPDSKPFQVWVNKERTQIIDIITE